MGKPIYTVTVPCDPDSMTVLETLCETFLATVPGVEEDKALALRLAVAEGCRNALVQQPGEGSLRLASLSFFRSHTSSGPGALAIEIRDPGPGLAVDGKLPPYPHAMTGRDFSLRGGLGFELLAKVESPWIARLRIRELTHPGSCRREDMLSELGRRGYGLMVLCRSWGEVLYHHREHSGTTLRLSAPNIPPGSV